MNYKKMSFRIANIVCMLLMIFYSHAIGQNKEPQNYNAPAVSLGLSAGINDFNQRDNYLSPYSFGGVSFASKIFFQAESESNRHRVDGFFSIGSLNPDVQGREVTEKVGYFAYSFVHSIDSWEIFEQPLQLSIGGGISSSVINTDFNTTDETGYTKLDQSWYWSHSINLVLLGEYRIDREKSLTLQFTAPVIGLVSRPENGHRLNQKNMDVINNFLNASTQGKVEYLWSNFVLYTDIEYRQALAGNFDLLAAYRFSYVSSNKPASLLSLSVYMNNFTVGILWSI